MSETDAGRVGGPVLMSIGHSIHPIKVFVGLLRQHGVEVVVDVRTSPYSRFNPQVNRDNLRYGLREVDIRYLFLGEELGGKPDGDEFYDGDGHVLYGRLAETKLFETGIARLLEEAKRYRVAIMCSEENPAVCHRYLLITRELHDRGLDVTHIRGDKSTESTEKVAGVEDGTDPWSEQMSLIEPLERMSWRSKRPVTRTGQRVP